MRLWAGGRTALASVFYSLNIMMSGEVKGQLRLSQSNLYFITSDQPAERSH